MYRDNYNRMFSETRAFSDQIHDPMFQEVLAVTSNFSEEDMANRLKVYSEVFSGYEDLSDDYRTFSGYSEMPLLANQYFNASMASYIRSFAGFLTIERSMDQPTSLLWYNDLLGVVDKRVVLPNIGVDNLRGISSRFQTNSNFIPGQKEYTISTNKKLIPGSVELHFINHKDPSNIITIKDDRSGNLLAPAGILAKNASKQVSVNYDTGVITFTVGDAFEVAAENGYSVIGFEDVAGDPAFGQHTGPGNNRFMIDHKNIIVESEPDMLISEGNLMTMAAAKKSVGFDMQEEAGKKLTELYTKLVNDRLTLETMRNGNTGNVVTIDMAGHIAKYADYNSRLDAFQADLVEVDTALAKKTSKAVRATAYLVGQGIGDQFRKLRNTGNWVDNTESTYVNDLLGYFNGVPVLRNLNVAHNDGYAVYKDPTGSVAPIMRGLFLPLTNTPIVGSYNNPTQFANGIYYQEANKCIFPELIQKFTVTV